jgi:dienelactone hydrolase
MERIIMVRKSNDSIDSTFNFEIVPSKALADERVSIRISGFKSNQPVTLWARMKDDLDRQWTSHAVFKADHHGVVDPSSQKPLSGTYDIVDPMGLFWSMALDPAEKNLAGFANMALTPIEITFMAVIGGKPVAHKTIERLFIAPDVIRTPVRENGLVGTFFHPAGSGPKSGVIVLGGSGGGLRENLAALLASHGYAALALAYFRMEHLPETMTLIPLEYFETAIHWMQAQDMVIVDKLAVIGMSRGGELVLLLGANFSEIKAVVAFVPSNVVNAEVVVNLPDKRKSAWSYCGEPFPFVPLVITDSDMMVIERRARLGLQFRITPYFLRAMDDKIAVEKATIPVEKSKCPILLISGQDDQMWPSDFYSKMVIERLEKNNYPYPYRHLSYRGAGHGLLFPYIPKTLCLSRHPVQGISYDLGGNPKDNAFASSDSWSKVLKFLEKSLKQ